MATRNKNIKKANVEVEYTPEQIQELYKCQRSPIYFIENYVKVQHPVKGSILLRLYPYQKRLIESYLNNRYNIVLSARQTGKCLTPSTVVTLIELSYNSPINKVKKFILKILDRKLYEQIYKNM